MLLQTIVVLLFILIPIISCTVDCNNTNTDSGKLINARLARSLVHAANFTILGVMSPIPETDGFPMSDIVSMSDGPLNGRSTGYIYFYLPKSSLIPRAIKMRNNLTALLTTGDRLNCIQNSEYPACYNVILSGSAVQLRPGTNEYALGLRAFISRHPEAIDVVLSNNFLLYKLVIQYVFVVSSNGKMNHVSLKDYFTHAK